MIREKFSSPVGRFLAVSIAFVHVVVQAADNDFAAPIVSVTSHQNAQIVNTRTIVLSGTATDAGRGGNGISSVYAKGTIAGATGVGNATVAWSQSITLNPGANYIDVYAYDNSEARNYSIEKLTINFQPLDTLAPTVVVNSHSNGQTVNTKTITLTGTATDAGTGNNGVSSVYVKGTIPGATAAGSGVAVWSQSVTLNPGANYIDVYAYDDSDVQNSKVQTLTINFQPVDPLGPNLVISSHANGQTVGASTIVLQGTASDAGRGDSGISSVYVRGTIPNSSTAGGGTVSWSKSVELHPGANYIEVYAYDNSDIQSSTSQSLTINFQPGDTLAPILSVTSHTNGQTVNTSSITISGTATDAGRGDNGISSVYLAGKLPNVAAVGSATVNWSKTIELWPGRNVINVYAYDGNEFPNEANQTLTINFQPADTLGPNLAITSHTDGQTVNSRSVTIRGTASDSGRGNNGISAVYLGGKIPDSTAAGAETANWSRVVELNPGRNSISVAAYDNSPFPNETSQIIVLNFLPADTLPPRLAVTSHTDGQIVFTNVVTVIGTATDAGRGDNGISSVRVNFVRANGDTATGAGVANWSRTFALNPGNNNIYVSATDGSEFQQETNITLRIVYQLGDVTPPELTIDTPSNNQTITTSSITISGRATDSGRGGNGVAGVTVNGINVPGSSVTGSATANWTHTINLVRGANVIAVAATDNSANRNTATETITVVYEPSDVTPPTLTIDSHRHNQTVSTSSITLAGVATDAGRGGSGISSVLVNGARANGDTAAGSSAANWSATINLRLGANVISVIARDGSPGRNDAAQTITIFFDPADTAPPEVQITSHRNTQTVTTPTIILAGIASDAGHGDSGISAVTVNSQTVAGGTAIGGAKATWTRTLNLNLGANIISVVARDNSANQNSAALTIAIYYEPVDLTAPDLEVTSHKNGQTLLSSSITLIGTATDADRGDNGIASVTLNGSAAIGGTATGAAKAAWSKTIRLNLGENVISIVATDGKQNSAAATLVLIYDPKLALTAGNFCWVKNAGGSGADAGYSIALDSEGNSYVTGSFEGGASFGKTNLTSRGLSDIFVTKYDANGNLLWARQAGGSGTDAGLSVAVSTNGNCFVTGYYSTTANFDRVNLMTTGSFDLFVAKYDPDGKLLWATNTGRGVGILGSGIALDRAENCYVTGSFAYDAFFGGTQFLNNEYYDGFLAKFDQSGRLLWATQFGGEGEDRSTGIAVDASGRCHVTGYFEGDAFFEDLQITSAGDHDSFVCQYDSEGNLQWLQQAGELGETQAAAIRLDPSGNCFVTGYYDSIASFGTNALSCDGFFDLFLAKYDPTGNLLWARNTGASTAINGAGVATDAAGNAFVTGSFIGPAKFGELMFTNTALPDIFVAKYDSDGSFLWAKSAGGEQESSGFGIAVSPTGVCHITGSTSGLANFGGTTITSNGQTEMFVAKLSDGVSAVPPPLSIRALSSAQFQLQFMGESCSNYRLQASSDLKQWATLISTNAPAGPVTVIENSGSSHQFYRVISP